VAEAHLHSEPLLLTHPRVYQLPKGLVLIVAKDVRLKVNTRALESCPAPDLAVPASRPIFGR